jgi:hypothetical protein
MLLSIGKTQSLYNIVFHSKFRQAKRYFVSNKKQKPFKHLKTLLSYKCYMYVVQFRMGS